MKLLPTSFMCMFFLLSSNILYAQSTTPDSLRMHFTPKPVKLFVGYYKGEEKMTRKELGKELKYFPDAYVEYKKSKRLTNRAKTLSIPSSLVISYSLIAWSYEDVKNPNILVPLVSGLLYSGGLILHRKSRAKTEKAIKIYNQSISLGMNINENGIGMRLNF